MHRPRWADERVGAEKCTRIARVGFSRHGPCRRSGCAGATEGGARRRLFRLVRFGQPHIGVGCMSMNAILPIMVGFKALYGRGMRACVQWNELDSLCTIGCSVIDSSDTMSVA